MALDVCITSTCRKNLIATIESFENCVFTSKKLRYLVNIDVIPRNEGNLSYILKYLKAKGIKDINVSDNPSHADAINYLYKKIQSKYYFNLEDDWEFLGNIDLDQLVNVMENNLNISNIRFPKNRNHKFTNKDIHKYNSRGEHYLVPGEEVLIDGLKMISSGIFSLNPHLGCSKFVKGIPNINREFNPENFINMEYLNLRKPINMNYNNGFYILGGYGSGPMVKDTGRLPVFIQKIATIIRIVRNPRLISKKRRLENDEKYRGKTIN